MPVQFHHRVLSNGLNIIAEANNDAHTCAIGFFVKTGTRDEEPPNIGVSHFLEHMMFKGTARRSADDVNREFDAMGASYNAFTSHEQTVYYAQVLPEFAGRVVDLLGDILRPALRSEDFEMEKKVILEEIGMYDDQPTWRLQDTLLEDYFGEHPLSFRVLGTAKSISKLQAPKMQTYFEQRYSPDNIVVAAAGRIDFDKLVDKVQRATSHWQPTGAQRRYENPQATDSQRTIDDGKVNRHYLGLMCPGPSAQDQRRYAAKVLADLIGDCEGSRLYWALVDPGLADEADFSFLPYDQTGSYFGYVSCAPDRAGQVEAKFLETIESISNHISPDELERARNKLATAATLQGEQPAGRMRALGGQWTYLGEYSPLAVELEKLTAVSIADIHNLLEEMPLAPMTIVRLTPAEVPPEVPPEVLPEPSR